MPNGGRVGFGYLESVIRKAPPYIPFGGSPSKGEKTQ